MKISDSEFVFEKCSVEDLDEILQIQKETLETLENSEILRANTNEMLAECLVSPNVTVCARYNGKIAGFSVLYYPKDDGENLAKCLKNVETNGIKNANYKLCIVREEFRGNSLQYKLASKLIEIASASGVKLICATVSPHNPYSIKNIERLGFAYNRTLTKYGYDRKLYYKFL